MDNVAHRLVVVNGANYLVLVKVPALVGVNQREHLADNIVRCRLWYPLRETLREGTELVQPNQATVVDVEVGKGRFKGGGAQQHLEALRVAQQFPHPRVAANGLQHLPLLHVAAVVLVKQGKQVPDRVGGLRPIGRQARVRDLVRGDT